MQSAAWVLTFAVVVVGWVFLPATSLESSLGMLMGMAGSKGFTPAASVEPALILVALWTWCPRARCHRLRDAQHTGDHGHAPAAHLQRPRTSPCGHRKSRTASSGHCLFWAAAVAALPRCRQLNRSPSRQPTSFLYFNFDSIWRLDLSAHEANSLPSHRGCPHGCPGLSERLPSALNAICVFTVVQDHTALIRASGDRVRY